MTMVNTTGPVRIEMTESPKVRTCLWFDDSALAAARFYCALPPDSQIHNIERHSEGQDMAEPGTVLLVEFTLAGTRRIGVVPEDLAPFELLTGRE